MSRRYLEELHPAVSFLFFVVVLGFTMTCTHPVMTVLSLGGAVLCSALLNGWRAVGGTARFALPLFVFIAIANPLLNHRGVTLLFILFDQWITLEALVYGLVSGASLIAVIYWFACYQKVVTSDKFLFLFGKAAPNTALMITMTLRLIPQLKDQHRQIREARQMLQTEEPRILQRLAAAVANLSTLLSWSMENAVEMADSMKARGYGLRRRTTFHLFRFSSRDGRVLGLLLSITGICLFARAFGHGVMEFYPRMTRVITGQSGMTLYVAFFLLVCLPLILDGKEWLRWRCYGLSN